jgi:protocatechuate 3,4-dioxygenase, beta subunit
MPNDRDQPARAIRGYVRSLRRTPERPPVRHVPNSRDRFGIGRVLEPADRFELDISRIRPGAPRALGQLIRVTGRVLDEDGRPVREAIIELWQANAAGKYVHELDPSPSPIDPNFLGVGRVIADRQGRFSVLTIKPGAYAVPYEERGAAVDWWRPPHIHFSIFGPAFASRLVTQMYFPGEPLNDRDLLLNSIGSPKARRRMIAAWRPDPRSRETGALRFDYELVVGGRASTPFEES